MRNQEINRPSGTEQERAPFPAMNCRAIFILPLRGKDRQMSLNQRAKIKTYPYKGVRGGGVNAYVQNILHLITRNPLP